MAVRSFSEIPSCMALHQCGWNVFKSGGFVSSSFYLFILTIHRQHKSWQELRPCTPLRPAHGGHDLCTQAPHVVERESLWWAPWRAIESIFIQIHPTQLPQRVCGLKLCLLGILHSGPAVWHWAHCLPPAQSSSAPVLCRFSGFHSQRITTNHSLTSDTQNTFS